MTTTYICETLEENATLKIKVAELLQRCDLLDHELEHSKDRIESLEAELEQYKSEVEVLLDQLGA